MNKAKISILLQLCLGGLTAFFWGIFGGLPQGLAALLAVFISISASLFFAMFFFRYQGAQQIKKIALAFYMGEIGKLLLTALLFFITIKYVTKSFLPLLSTYIMCQLSWIFVLIFERNKTTVLK